MYHYELHQLNVAELIRRADHERTVREALVTRRAVRRAARLAGRDDTEGRVSGRRDRFTRAA
ncbi:hypothetical protein [Streptomyces sp. B1I3]|uniref:hypothetical protein n=1 Tax=Streptomyces sp. B1I3 TaxID=3042264 RepID=UPI0027D8AE55|nr:hypothetical protein [Streptomyces sp. B1I3]